MNNFYIKMQEGVYKHYKKLELLAKKYKWAEKALKDYNSFCNKYKNIIIKDQKNITYGRLFVDKDIITKKNQVSIRIEHNTGDLRDKNFPTFIYQFNCNYFGNNNRNSLNRNYDLKERGINWGKEYNK